MNILKFPPTEECPLFFEDIIKHGYHIYSLKKAAEPDFYPDAFPEYLPVLLQDLQIGDIIVIRVFFGIGQNTNMEVDGGYIDLEIEQVEDKSVLANILTDLPDEFALSTGESIELFADEILTKAENMMEEE